MQLKAVLLALAAGFLMVPFAHAATQRTIDARNFDIAGVKLGMNLEEARAAAAKHFQVLSIEFDKVPGKDWFVYKKDGATLTVQFVQRVPDDASHSLVVHEVKYAMPATAGNSDAMKEAALAKYGPPTYDGKYIASWCAKPELKTGQCFNSQDEKAVLHLKGLTLELQDLALQRAILKQGEKLKTPKPNF